MEAAVYGSISAISMLMSTVAPFALLGGGIISPEFIARGIVQSAVVIARSGMDIQYGGIVYDEKLGSVALREVRVVPPESADLPGCTITIDALTLAPQLLGEDLSLRIEGDSVQGTPACAGPMGPLALGILGPQALHVAHLSAVIDYAVPASAANVNVFLETASLGAVDFAVAAEGLHLTHPEDDEPLPGGKVTLVEMTVQDIDTLRAFLPILGVGDAPGATASEALEEFLGDRAASEDGKRLISSAESEISRVMAEGGGLSLRSAPGVSVSFAALADTDGPEDLVPLLKPTFSDGPAARDALIDSAAATALLKEPDTLEDAQKWRLADALASGTGLPAMPERAAALYLALAEGGDADAALAYARLEADTDAEGAYRRALDAGAGGAGGARLVLDRIEGALDPAQVLALQAAALGEKPEPGDSVSQLRRDARAYAQGRGVPRNYGLAMLNGLLAAAAGDRASASLVAGLRTRFADDAAWDALVTAQSQAALDLWAAGLGDRLAGKAE